MVCARTPVGLARTGARSTAEARASGTAKPRVAAGWRAQRSAREIPEKERASSAGRPTPGEAARAAPAWRVARATSAGRPTRAARSPRTEAVISHVVLFRPKPDLTAADREALIAAFEFAVSEIPDVRGVRVGRRVTH